MHNLCHAQNDGVHIPHPTDCSKFVQCDKSCAVVKICANGTAFDDSLGNCNHEYLVNCPEISKKAITDFSNLARSDRKFGGTAPKNPNPNYIEIQMENELKLSKIETEYDDEYAATETSITPDIELGIDTASEDPETTLKPEKPEVDTVTEKPEIDTVIEESESVTVPEEPEMDTVPEELEADNVTEEPEIVTVAMDPETLEVTEGPEMVTVPEEPAIDTVSEEPEYDDEYAATETTIKPDIELGIDKADEEPETTLKPEEPEVDTVTEEPEIDTVIEESERVRVPEEPEIVTVAMNPETLVVTITPDIELGIDTANEEPEITHENERPRTAQDTVVNWLLETNEVENNFHDANIVPIPYIRTENLQWKK